MTYPISVERLIKIWLIDGIQIIGNTIYYTVWTNDGYGNTFASFSDNLLHIILLPYNSSEPMAKYVAYIRGVKSHVNNRYFMYAKVNVCTDSTTETHDYQNRSRGNDICTGAAVCWIAQFHPTKSLWSG